MGGTEIAFASIVTTVLSTSYSIYSSEKQKKQVEAIAAAENENKRREAAAIQQQAQIDLQRQRKLNRAILARQEAESVASGIETGTGTPLERLANNAATLELEALEQFREKQVVATQQRNKGLMALAQGKAKGSALRSESISAGIEGVDSVLSLAPKFKKTDA